MTCELSEEKKQTCKEIFNYFDKDLDKKLKGEEIGDAMKALGICLSQEELKQLLNESPEMKYENFELFAGKKLSQKVNKSMLINAFSFLDKDNTGLVNYKDFHQALISLGDPLSPEDADKLLKPYITKENKIQYKNVITALVGR